jgi:hypothetical protein
LITSSTHISSEPSEEEIEDEVEFIKKEQDEICAAEKVHRWNIEKPDVGGQDSDVAFEESDIAIIEDEEGNEEDYAITHFPEAWAFLTSSHAYEWLLGKIRTDFLLTKMDGTLAENIKETVIKGLASVSKKLGYCQAESKARFDIACSLPEFLKEKYPNELSLQLRSLITIVGSEDDVQALTCAQYMNQVWPVTGLETLLALQGALDKGAGQTYQGNQTLHSSV